MFGRLLILSCSQQKSPASQLLPAIERYQGPAFKVLRKYLREDPSEPLQVLILSGKYGLIRVSHKIPNYNVRLTAAAAEAIQPAILKRLRETFREAAYLEVGFCLGRYYRRAVEGYKEIVPERIKVTFIQGGLGCRLTNLRNWLRRCQREQTGGKQPGG
jgi:hypothetical protein